MKNSDVLDSSKGFFNLSPHLVLDSIEESLYLNGKRVRSTGFIQALNSIENRVFEAELEGNVRVVTKFYRPGRWSAEQINEEHEFTTILQNAEIPVVSPYLLTESKKAALLGPSLAQNSEGLFFTVYPKVGGRLKDELNTQDVRTCGKLIAQMHNLGESLGNSSRRQLNTQNFINNSLKILKEGSWMSDELWTSYESLALAIRDFADPLLKSSSSIRIHGDCHVGNVIWNWNEEPLFVDFDDMMIGPAVQDLWMLIRGRESRDLALRNEFLEAYNYFREFPLSELNLIESLRALRMIHYSAWIAQRWNDPSFPHFFPHFGSSIYWQEEIQALRDIQENIWSQ